MTVQSAIWLARVEKNWNLRLHIRRSTRRSRLTARPPGPRSEALGQAFALRRPQAHGDRDRVDQAGRSVLDLELRGCHLLGCTSSLHVESYGTPRHNVKYLTILIAVNLRLSKRGDYVVRSAICLAGAYESGAPKKLREVSAEMGVPRTFVSQILGDLVHAGLAVSTFGSNGGYRLARSPDQMSLLEVVEAGEGPLAPEACALGEGPCRWGGVCPLHEAWSAAGNALGAVLASTSLAELVEADRAIEAGTYPVPADSHRLAARSVAVADSVHVELSAAAVAARLRAGGSWLVPHLQAASAEGEAIRLRVGPAGPAWLGKTVGVHLGEPDGTDEVLVVPLAWEATGPSGLFPRFEGELRLTALDPERAELRLSGRYRPPLGTAGQVLDAAGLAHVAHATIRALLRRVARVLEQAPEERRSRRPVPAAPAASPVVEGSLAGRPTSVMYPSEAASTDRS